MHFKAGDYYVGDLCYVLSDEDYDSLVDISNVNCQWEGRLKGYPFFIGRTKYGDGVYVDNDNDEYFVDSGTIGIVPEEMIDSNNRADLGQIIEFSSEFEVSYDDGVFQFGDLLINTKNYGIGEMLARHTEEERGNNK